MRVAASDIQQFSVGRFCKLTEHGLVFWAHGFTMFIGKNQKLRAMISRGGCHCQMAVAPYIFQYIMLLPYEGSVGRGR